MGTAEAADETSAPLLARVVVVAGPSGCGKTSFAERTGLPIVALDDFYRPSEDPGMPRRGGHVDWEDPASWDGAAAVKALAELCRTGRTEVPTYSLAEDRAVGVHAVDLGGAPLIVAEGIFAAEIVDACRDEGILADALLLRARPLATFWRRLRRDHHERRKPLLVLLRQGIDKLRRERAIVERQRALGCRLVARDDALAAIAAGRGPSAPA